MGTLNAFKRWKIRRGIKKEPECWLQKSLEIFSTTLRPLTAEDRYIIREIKKELERRIG